MMAIIGDAIKAGGQFLGGIAQGQADSYQAKVASNNAIAARQNAAYAASAGAAQTEEAGLKARNQAASVRAGQAAEGVDVNSGSAADVQTSQREIGALDTATVSNNAALEAYGYQSQATSFQAQANLDRAEAGYAPFAGAIQGAGTLLSNPSVDSSFSSLLSGTPSTPPNYQWMQSSGTGSSSGYDDGE
jgi:hypothetical protein